MQKRGFLALVSVTVLVVAGAVGVSLSGGTPGPEKVPGGPVLPTVAQRVADVASITVKHDKGVVTLQRRKDDWVVAEKGGYPADPTKVRQALLGLAELKFGEAKTRKADLYPRLEVEDVKAGTKSALVTVKDGKGGKLGELIVGKSRPDRFGTGTDGVYVRLPGAVQAWLARGSLDVTGEAKDWLDKKIVDVSASRVRSVALIQPDGSRVVLEREKKDGPFRIADAPSAAKPKSDSTLAEPAGSLANLELDDVKPAGQFKFPEAVNKAELATFDGLTLAVTVAQKDGAQWIRLAATGTGDKATKEAERLNARLSPWVYAVPGYKVNPLKQKLADFLEPPPKSS